MSSPSGLSAPQKVLIIGAGPAGACLAQILRGNDVPFEIFERDVDLDAHKGGSFTLDDALPYLTEGLPDDMGDWWSTSVNFPRYYDTIVQVEGDSLSPEIKMYQTGFKEGESRPVSIMVKRSKFRSWMAQKLPVQTGKRFSHYSQDEEGVTAYFSDGTVVRGSILVGADGSSSAVRKQLLDNPRTTLHQFVPICGDFIIKGDALRQLRSMATGAVAIFGPSEQAMFGQLELSPGENDAHYWWLVSFRSEDPQADTEWIKTASKEQLFAKAMSQSRSMPPFVGDILVSAGVESVWSPQIRFSEYVPPAMLPAGRITLIGDAAHNTTPYGGMGANTGLKDACDLGKLLREQNWHTSSEVAKLLDSFGEIMLPRGQKVVLSSRAVGLSDSMSVGNTNPEILEWHDSIKTLDATVPLEEFVRSGIRTHV